MKFEKKECTLLKNIISQLRSSFTLYIHGICCFLDGILCVLYNVLRKIKHSTIGDHFYWN